MNVIYLQLTPEHCFSSNQLTDSVGTNCLDVWLTIWPLRNLQKLEKKTSQYAAAIRNYY